MLSCRMSASFSRQLRLLCPGQLSVRSCCLAAYPPSSRQRGGPDTKVVLPHSWLTSSGPAVSPQLLSHSWLLLPSSGQMRNFSSSSLRFSEQTVLASSVPTAAPSSTDINTTATVNSAAVPPPPPSEGASAQELILDFLPERPSPVDPTVMLGEPSLDSLGLASWWPAGRVQYFLEQLHLGLGGVVPGLEWYQAIALTTVCLRFLTFPFVVMAQRNVANMNNHTPGMVAIQEKMTDARQRGDHMEMAQYSAQLQNFMKKKGINPLKNVVPIVAQIPIFMSMFLGLRAMANLPVPSMETGGILWFENLAMADPFYLLPLLTSTTLYIQIRMGADGARLNSMGPMARVFFTVFPFALLPITMNFPCAVTFYWFCTNVVSCTQASLLRLPAVRAKLNIPKLLKFDPNKAGTGPKKGFRETVRETIDNWKVQGDIIDRRAQDEQAFREAGTAKIKKTYPYDPTKPVAIRARKI